jgi:hypothetical protein
MKRRGLRYDMALPGTENDVGAGAARPTWLERQPDQTGHAGDDGVARYRKVDGPAG